MGAILAVTLVAALVLGAWAIGLLAACREGWTKPVATTCLLLFLGLAVHHTGGLGTVNASWLKGQATATAQGSQERCTELLTLMRENGILTDGPDELSVRVRSSYWNRLPTTVHDIATSCLETERALSAGTLKVLEDDG